jgi:hypothetical protein
MSQKRLRERLFRRAKGNLKEFRALCAEVRTQRHASKKDPREDRPPRVHRTHAAQRGNRR